MPRLGGRFELGPQVAEGGFSIVHRAVDLETGAPAAVKLVASEDPAGDARAQREAAVLLGLDHPAIIRLLGHGFTGDGRLYLATEWIEGATLADVAREDGLTQDESLLIARRVAEALACAHAAGIAHRDVKPANIMLRGRDPARALLLDFGIARPPNLPSLTETGTVIGTPGFMAPEQVRGDRAAGAPADVFALGCVLHELLTGQRAFPGRTYFAVETRILFGEPAAPVRGGAVGDLVRAMLAKQPGDRPAAAAVAAALAAVPAEGGGRRVRREDDGREAPTARDPVPAAIVVAVAMDDRVSWPSFGVRQEVLRDGTLVCVLDGDAAPVLARRAADLALALRRSRRGICVAVATGALDGVDQLAGVLARELVGAGLGGPRGVIVDEATAALLGDGYAIARQPGGGELRLLDTE